MAQLVGSFFPGWQENSLKASVGGVGELWSVK